MTTEVLHLRQGAASIETLTAAALAAPTDASDARGVREAVEAALAAPLEFPPLDRAVTPDDHIGIALGEGTPDAAAVVAGVVSALAHAGLRRDRMAVVTADPIEADALAESLADEVAAGVVFEAHDPADDEALCFAGMTRREQPLMLNRRLFDADVLLPVSAERPAEAGDGPFDGVFPSFCDRETIDRVHRVRSLATARARGGEHAAARRREADEAGWLFGAPLVVRVVPGATGAAPRVVAGDPRAVARSAGETGRAVWEADLPDAAALVIARLGPRRGWRDVGAALAAIDPLVAPGGCVALWTDLDEPVGAELGRLARADEPLRVARELDEASGASALAAWRVAQALDRGPVFLRSRIAADVVEDLGFTPISDEAELLRLAGRMGRSVLVDDAENICFRVAGVGADDDPADEADA